MPGHSLGGIRLGETTHDVRAALGRRFGVCNDCARPTWYFTYKPFDSHGLAVEFDQRRVSAVYTLWKPPGWRATNGLRLGATPPPSAQPRRPAPHDHMQGLRRAGRRPAGLAHRVLPLRRLALGIRALPAALEPVPMIELADVEAAANRLAGVAHRTPVVTSRTLDERVGARVHIKAECFQRGGAFKFRGAYNKISSLDRGRARARRRRATPPATTRKRSRSRRGSLGSHATIVMPGTRRSRSSRRRAATAPRS